MYFFLVFLLISATIGNPLSSKVDHFPTLGRIIGGSIAKEGDVPWQVAITVSNSIMCGGSIVSSEWIVTAAHCSNFASFMYRIRSGSLNYKIGGTVHTVTKIIVHPKFTPTLENDIALWKVFPAFNFDLKSTKAVNLPNQSFSLPAGTIATVSGWGATENGSSSSMLLKVKVSVVDYDECNAAYGGLVPSNQICADSHNKDSCQGDSGGPLFTESTKTIYGIVSWGSGCALPGYPGVYTEVSKYTAWIKSIITKI